MTIVKDILAIFGGASLLTCLFSIIVYVGYSIYELIKKAMFRYKVKHRFDKKPQAKCYCRDCVYGEVNETCKEICICSVRRLNHSDSSWFCADAVPRTQEVD